MLRWHTWRQEPRNGRTGPLTSRVSATTATNSPPANVALFSKQAKVLLDYAEGTLKSTPLMRQLLNSRTADTLTLTTGIALVVRSASFRRIRGVTCVAVLADECAF